MNSESNVFADAEVALEQIEQVLDNNTPVIPLEEPVPLEHELAKIEFPVPYRDGEIVTFGDRTYMVQHGTFYRLGEE